MKVSLDGILIQNQLAQSFLEGSQCYKSVSERHSHISEHSRIRKVTLQTGNRQFHGQECEHGVGHSQVALRILEIDRVHLVRHCRRAHLILVHLLLEIFHRYVSPDITGHVDKNGIDTPQAVENGSQVVVMLYLRGRERTLQAERIHKPVTERNPVDVRERHLVRIHIAGSTAELGRIGKKSELPELLLKTDLEHLEFLAQTCRRSRLAMRLGKHRNIFPLLCHT